MLMTSGRRPAIRTLRGWAIHVLQEAGAIRECEEHGWMQEPADPHARERAFDIARRDPPADRPVSGWSLRPVKETLETCWMTVDAAPLHARRGAKQRIFK